MRKIIALIIFIIIIFWVNLLFYFLSEDYRFFLKKIKEKDDVIHMEEKNYNDNLEKVDINNIDTNELVEISNKNEEIFDIELESWKIELKNEVVLGKNYTKIVDLFSIYKINRLEINTNLFDLTDEYPDNYFEYYSKDLTLYLFPTKTYSEVHDIFSVLSDELPFIINDVDNFWDNSFYINLDKDIEDRFIRLVISNKWVVFWLKIKKTEYSLIKEKLNLLKEVSIDDKSVEEIKEVPLINNN